MESGAGHRGKPREGQAGSRLLVAVDGGATSTKAALVRCREDGSLQVVRSLSGAGVNPYARGEVAARDSLRGLLFEVSDGYEVAAVAVGVSGSVELAREEAHRAFPSASVLAVSDVALPALAHPLHQVRGVVSLVGGTGSIAVRIPAGATQVSAVAGGWGWFLGDEGSGVDMGRSAARAVLSAASGGRATLLTGMLAEHLGCAQEQVESKIYQAVYSHEGPQAAVSALAPLVIRASELGDDEASRVCSQAVQSLAGLVRQVYRPGDCVAVTGSVAYGLRRALGSSLVSLAGDSSLVRFSRDAVADAAVAAAGLVGISVSRDALRKARARALE